MPVHPLTTHSPPAACTQVSVNFCNTSDKKHASKWVAGAVEHLDAYNSSVPLYICAGSFGSVWADVYLAGPMLNDSKFALKRTRVSIYETPDKDWAVILDASFEEDWLTSEVRLIDDAECKRLVSLVKTFYASSTSSDDMTRRKDAYEKVYEQCYRLVTGYTGNDSDENE